MMLRRMKIENATVHGFRSSFRDWAGNVSSFPRELIETALAHVIGDKAEQAYRRSDAFDKLMDAWAAYCELKPQATSFKFARTIRSSWNSPNNQRLRFVPATTSWVIAGRPAAGFDGPWAAHQKNASAVRPCDTLKSAPGRSATSPTSQPVRPGISGCRGNGIDASDAASRIVRRWPTAAGGVFHQLFDVRRAVGVGLLACNQIATR